MHNLYSFPIFAYKLQTYLLDDLQVRYLHISKYSNCIEHVYRIVYNAADLYDIRITITESETFISINVANSDLKEEVLVLKENSIINTLIDLCNRLEIRIFK